MKPIIIANWKMHFSFDEACNYFHHLLSYSFDFSNVIFAVPSLYLSGLKLKFNKYNFSAQDISVIKDDYGPYTGEISAIMLKGLNINYAIIGHSERRKLFSENENIISLKARNCVNNNIIPIICIGETKEERKNKIEYINKRLISLSFLFSKKIIIAYEPIWSIGNGELPTKDEIIEVVDTIRNIVADVANNVKIVYGGSVSPRNIGEVISTKIDGVLIGSSSLDPRNLIKIIQV